MAFLILFIAVIILVIFCTEDKTQKGFIGAFIALLYLPIAVIFALAKKYK